MKLDKEVFNPEKLAEALENAIRNHPALPTMFDYNDDGELVQCNRPDLMRPIHVEKMSEFEFRFVKDTLVFPFKLIGGRMSRCRVIETEKAVYVFFDVHHSPFDGTSLKVFLESIGKSYMGVPLDPDYSEEHSRCGGKVFMYYWEERSRIRFLRACHAVELSYVFGNIQDTIYTWAPADPGLSGQVQDQWVRFAETGDPGTPELPWPAYEEENRWTMILRKDSQTMKDPMPEEREVLFPILDYRLNASYAEMKFNVPFVWKGGAKILLLLLSIGLVVYLLLSR